MIDCIWHIVKKVVDHRKGRVVLLGWLWLGIAITHAQSNGDGFEVYPTPHLVAMQSILDMSPAAASQLALLRRNYPTHPATVYLDNYKALVDFLAHEKPLDAQTFPILAEQRMSQIAERVSVPIAAVYQCNILLQVGLVQAMGGNHLKAFRAIVKANQLYKQIPLTKAFWQEREKLSLVFDLFWSMVPDEYHWALDLWSDAADLGNTNTRLAAYLDNLRGVVGLGDEAYLLSSIYQLKSGNGKVPHRFTHNSKPLLLYVDGLLALKSKQQQQLLPFIDDSCCQLFPPLYYIKGRMLLNALKEGADASLQLFLEQYNGPTFKLDAQLRLAWCALLADNKPRAQLLGQELMNGKAASSYADRQALSEAKYLASTQVDLLKMRLLFDAGQYNQSLEVALNHSQLRGSNPCEYFYRMGRARHELGVFEMAISDYDRAMRNNTEPTRYFAPNAALKSAEIYLTLGQIEKAKAMLKKCLSLNVDEYAESIKAESRQLLKIANSKGNQ